MNAKKLKELYEKMPEPAKVTAGPMIHRGLIKNPVFLQQYEELLRADTMSEEELKALQFQKLKDLCAFAYENTAYYHRVFDECHFDCYHFRSVEEFSEKVPYLTKADVLRNYDEINAPGIRGDYPASTGGSSGTRLVVNNSKECFYRENAFIYHHYLKLGDGVDFRKSRIAYVGGDGKTLITFSPLYNMMRYNSKLINSSSLPQVVRSFNRFKPDLIRGLPSALYFLCKLMDEANTQLLFPIRGVVFQSENIYPHQRKLIERVLHCKSLAYYGHTERTIFAEEYFSDDELPQYVFNRLYGLVEVDAADDNALVGTGFINHKMPLIRYKTDDRVVFLPNGRCHIVGHRTAAMIGSSGERFSVASFTDMDAVFDQIDKFQFVQKRPGAVRVDLIPKHALSKSEQDAIYEALDRKFMGRMEITLNYVKELQLTDRGKYTPLIQKIDLGGGKN